MKWIDLLNEGISLFLIIMLGISLYRGFKKNQMLLLEREGLLRRYLLFRGDKNVRLKVYGEDEKVYQDLLKNLSNSWKNFKKVYDQYLFSFAQNTSKTKLSLLIITLALLANTARLVIAEYLSFGIERHLPYIMIKELPSYVLVILSFFLLRMQTRRLLALKGETAKMDRELLFSTNSLSEEEHEVLYNEFDPLDGTGEEGGKKNQSADR